MCEPVTIGLIATTVIGGALTAVGQIQSANAAQASADYQAAVLRNNEIIANQNAADAIARGQQEEQFQRLEKAAKIARVRVAFAGQGQVVDEGSALDLTDTTAAIEEFKALQIRNAALREASGFEAIAENFAADAELATFKGGAVKASLPFELAGTILGTAKDSFAKFRTVKNSGLIGGSGGGGRVQLT